jgi:ABC-type glycerol-3-phosphate transport system substrate-binding protein
MYEEQQYQIDASRNSAFNDPSLVKQFPYLPNAGYADEHAHVIETSILNEFFQLNSIMNVEFNKALIGGQSASAACATVQSQWEDILRKGGYLA